ncbi:hypothetical protein MAR_022615 [Mya arenaria]|uniref:RING-type domain-containing protein n=1 Tax=Mya arenaria TaxID=6604 RepID=A0ABY7DKN3_MYAAR|nr:uncharacterized protein LOC128228859 [Mya arenaria]WAQ98242.1 hypothetical protein MAR_022615 [Mya arenaria]
MASTNQLSKVLSDEARNLMCGICSEYPEEPKELPCGHHFCLPCLQIHCLSVADPERPYFPCPECGKNVIIQDPTTPVLDWVHHIPTNKTKQKQLERLTALAKEKRRQSLICSFCNTKWKNALATKYCKACQEYFCDECGNQHWLLRATKEHRVWLVDDLHTLKTDSLLRSSLTLLFNAKWKGRKLDKNAKHNNQPKVISESESDEFDIDITGVGFINNSHIIMADRMNERVKLFDHNYVLKNSIRMKCFDLLVLEDNHVVVTCPLDENIKYIHVSGNKLHETSTLDINNECYGLCYMHNNMYAVIVATDPISILVIKNNNRFKTIELATGKITMKTPRYIDYFLENKTFVLTDTIHQCVKNVSASGEVLWERKVPGCKGVAFFGNHVLIARSDRATVDLMSSKGQFLKSIVRLDDGLAEVQAIRINAYFDSTAVTSLIVSENTNLVRIFRVEDPLKDEDLIAYIMPGPPLSVASGSSPDSSAKSPVCSIL